MKKLFTLIAFLLVSGASFATIHNVEVGGGGGQGTPYYSPQFITIDVGDTVLWTFVTGTHNVTSTSGPSSFASGNLSSPASFQHIFTLPGAYDYECTLFNHANTQFGTITVESTVNLEDEIATSVILGPNPVSNVLRVKAPAFKAQVNIRLYEAGSGKVLREEVRNASTFEIGMGDLPSGIYFLELSDANLRIRKKLLKN